MYYCDVLIQMVLHIQPCDDSCNSQNTLPMHIMLHIVKKKKVPSLQNGPRSRGNFDLPKFINNSRPLFHSICFQIDPNRGIDPTEFE